jgi:hypothetical protein
MANPNGRKGAEFERQTADYWRDNWDDRIDRRVRTGAKDKGDLANVRIRGHRIVVECKDEGNKKKTAPTGGVLPPRYNLPGWIGEAQVEAENDGALCGIVVAKRRGKGQPEDQFVILTQGDFLRLLAAITTPT